jgi:hypothetical protein
VEQDKWFNDWFVPTTERIAFGSLSWETVLDFINQKDSNVGTSLEGYYSQ